MASTRRFELSLARPLETARESIDRRRGVLFEVTTPPGGIGDATPLEPFTESYEACARTLERAVTAFESGGWSAALAAVSATVVHPVRGRRLQTPAARHAVSLAALDWRARRQAIPLSELLASEVADAVPVNATVGDGTVDETVDRAMRAVEAGFPAVKVKVGNRAVEADCQRLRATRQAIGSLIDLRVDVNGAWSRGTAERALAGMEGLDVTYVEQPLAVEETVAHRDLRGVGPPIAVDESLTRYEIATLLAESVAEYFVIKPTAVGGIDVAAGLAHRIERAGGTAVVSSIVESVVGRTAAVHLAATLGESPPAGLATADLLESDLGPDPSPVRCGSIAVPTDSGLGVEVRR